MYSETLRVSCGINYSLIFPITLMHPAEKPANQQFRLKGIGILETAENVSALLIELLSK